MSSQVLARKWRPKSFATLVGQEHVVRALTHALDQQRLHHAYLFTGTRGVGKTTLARIMAKALNCDAGVSSTPCGVCSACTEIDSGRFVDYLELDAASNRGVEDMTGLLEKATYAPTRGRYKVYVIDEVHQLSGHAFNAMLKTLEEPPEHVKFILATTDPQKIPVTVLSRCLQFNLKQMPPGHIVDHLTNILGQENVAFEPAALRHIAKGAAGSMRDALSLLDQAIAHGAGKVEEAGVRDMLGTVGDDYLYGILDGLVAGDIDAMLNVAAAMDARSLSFDSALQELATLFHRVALAQFAPQAMVDADERARLAPYAAALDAEFLQLCYQIAIHGRDDLDLAPDEYAGFSMTRPAPNWPMMACGSVFSLVSGTLNMFFFASSMPFLMAMGTSWDLPIPTPTLPAPSPTRCGSACGRATPRPPSARPCSGVPPTS
jgi:DNA polymerase-3 subunit gamma/tau